MGEAKEFKFFMKAMEGKISKGMERPNACFHKSLRPRVQWEYRQETGCVSDKKGRVCVKVGPHKVGSGCAAHL